MFPFGRIRERRRRRRNADPAKQIGNAVGRGLAGVLTGLVSSFLRKR